MIDISKLSILELKALAFDIKMSIEKEQQNYKLVINQLQKLINEQPKVSKEVAPIDNSGNINTSDQI